VQGLERHYELNRRAVGIGDDAAVRILANERRIDLRHDERHVLLEAKLRGVVDDDAACGAGARRVLARYGGARAEKSDLGATKIKPCEIIDRHVRAVKTHFLADRALTRQGKELGDCKVAL